MGREPSVETLASLVSKTLFARRFYPYGSFNIVCGLNAEGKSMVANYDGIGSFCFSEYFALGTSSQMMVPVLDTMMKGYHHIEKSPKPTIDQAVSKLNDLLNSCAERDINTGDGLEFVILRPGQAPEKRFFKMRGD